ncbi:MAG: urease accessory protein UreD, partial [Deltaproteobacteria bacterium]|nr:urease accessory protein UreD [Deltaproteobacteria bacterium]
FEGPLRVQKLFYPEKPAPGEVETCHLYLLHPPGGLVSGDLLEHDLRLTEGARAVVTTPAAAKIYRARDELSVQAIKTRVEVDDGSVLEWFPQGTIAFDGARASLGQAFDVALGARALGCDFVALGRGASGESFSKGAFRQLTQIFRGPKLLFHELVNLQGDDELLLSPLGLMGRPVMALFWAVGRPNRAGDAQALTDSLKTLQSFEDFGPGPYALAQSGSPVFSATSRHGLFLARALTASLQEAEAFRFRVWSIIRPRLLGLEPLPPHVWAT